ncbi:bestrophin family ion channel [Anaerolineales bacterium HSG24]|nr:bestrophin family ion channel [Anaerolineales bacterium HSG24]
MQILKQFGDVVDYKTGIITAISVVITYIFYTYQITSDIPGNLIGVAVVFPIVFAINSAYRRREDALSELASMRANAMAMFYIHRDWVKEDREEHASRIRTLNLALFRTLKDYLVADEEKENELLLLQIYQHFSDMSESFEYLREAGIIGAGMARVNIYHQNMMRSFENIRNIYIYRTPISLRAYTTVLLYFFPIIFSPYFALLGQKHFLLAGIGVSIVYSVVLVSLSNVQDNLEKPFDGIGQDDIRFDEFDVYEQVMSQMPSSPSKE